MKVKSGIYMSPSRVSKTGLTCVWGEGDGGGRGRWNLDKVVKNCMKITKSTFLGQTKEDMGG